MEYENLLSEAEGVVNRLIAERDAALALGDLIEAKRRDNEANSAAQAFFKATDDSRFKAPAMALTEAQQAAIATAVGKGLCSYDLEDSWSPLARSLERTRLGLSATKTG